LLRIKSIKFTDAFGKTYLINNNQIESFPLQGGEEANMISTKVWNQHGNTPINALMESVEGELIFIINTIDMRPDDIVNERRTITNICNPLNGTIRMTVTLNNDSIYHRDITFLTAPHFPIGRDNRNEHWQKVQLLYEANNPFWYAESEIIETFQGIDPLFEFPFSNEVIVPNLMPVSTFGDLTKFTDWYSTMSFSTEENNTILRAEMIAFETNPRMRFMTSTTNETILTEGVRYTFSFKILTSIKLKTLEYTQLIAYNPDNSYDWVDYGNAVDVDTLPKDENGYSIYSSSFVATKTGDARFGLGFGNGNNPELDNGTWFKIKDLKVHQSIENYVQPTIIFGEIIPNNIAKNEGQVEAPVVIEIKGACVNPRIDNETTGEFIAFKDLTMTSTQTLIIDTTFGHKKVELDGVNVFNKLDFSSTFFNLAIGENSIDFSDETGNVDATIHFIYKNLYITI
jgi:hypothetical protein